MSRLYAELCITKLSRPVFFIEEPYRDLCGMLKILEVMVG